MQTLFDAKIDQKILSGIYFRFASGFGADARRKRHTADSGYGSEQPLDRRWSQEFNQEVCLSCLCQLMLLL